MDDNETQIMEAALLAIRHGTTSVYLENHNLPIEQDRALRMRDVATHALDTVAHLRMASKPTPAPYEHGDS